MMKILNKIQVALYDIFQNLTAVVLAIILTTVTLGIVSRYVFNRPFMWTEELCTIMLVFLAFFSAPMATIAQEHIVADFFKSLIPEKYRRILSIIIRAFEIFFFVFLAYSTILYIPGRTFRTTALRFPRFGYYVPVLIGTLVIIYSLCVHMLNDFFPGFDLFKERRHRMEEKAKYEEDQENRNLEASMDSFMDKVEEAEKVKGERQ